MRRAILVVPVLVLALAALLGAPPAARLAAQDATPAAHDPAALLAAFDQGLQADDPAALAELFVADGVLMTAGGTFRGHAEIRGYFRDLIADNPALEVTIGDPTVAYNTAVRRDLVVADAFLAGGAERLAIIHTVVAVGGRIAVLTAIPDLGDPATLTFFTPMAPAATPAATPAG